MDTVSIASRFVDIALKYKQWSEVKELPDGEMQVLFEIVTAAGFEPKRIVLGKLRGNYLDQDGSRTGETYPINSLCPFKVVNQEGGDQYFVTGWLDCALRRVVFGGSRRNREQLIKAIQLEIERSIPLKPIQLTPEGDLLHEYPPSPHAFFGLEHFVDHTRDNHELSCCVGVHEYCNSWMDRVRATKTHDAIVCRGCHLRVLFPREIETYGELRQTLAT